MVHNSSIPQIGLYWYVIVLEEGAVVLAILEYLINRRSVEAINPKEVVVIIVGFFAVWKWDYECLDKVTIALIAHNTAIRH
jgi:hypothetical protein